MHQGFNIFLTNLGKSLSLQQKDWGGGAPSAGPSHKQKGGWVDAKLLKHEKEEYSLKAGVEVVAGERVTWYIATCNSLLLVRLVGGLGTRGQTWINLVRDIKNNA